MALVVLESRRHKSRDAKRQGHEHVALRVKHRELGSGSLLSTLALVVVRAAIAEWQWTSRANALDGADRQAKDCF